MLKNAIAQLQAGELVAFPTETVYGLGADARNPIAIQKVFAVKGRPADHPVIVHIARAKQLTEWAQDIPQAAWKLAEHFWPGPLTLILRKLPHVSPLITGGQNTIAIRIPNHPLTLELLQQFGAAIVGPSANKYGRVSPTCAEHVANDLGAEVATILDGGKCSVGIESTIINLTTAQPVIMRVGAISAAHIAAVLGQEIEINNNASHTVRTSGSHASHYAPRTPVQLCTSDELPQVVALYVQQNKRCSVLSFMPRTQNLSQNIYWQQVIDDPADYAYNLYANLRQHDQLNVDLILVEKPKDLPEWIAVLDRVQRASTHTLLHT